MATDPQVDVPAHERGLVAVRDARQSGPEVRYGRHENQRGAAAVEGEAEGSADNAGLQAPRDGVWPAGGKKRVGVEEEEDVASRLKGRGLHAGAAGSVAHDDARFGGPEGVERRRGRVRGGCNQDFGRPVVREEPPQERLARRRLVPDSDDDGNHPRRWRLVAVRAATGEELRVPPEVAPQALPLEGCISRVLDLQKSLVVGVREEEGVGSRLLNLPDPSREIAMFAVARATIQVTSLFPTAGLLSPEGGSDGILALDRFPPTEKRAGWHHSAVAWGFVLVGGLSSRMGRDKALLPVGGKALALVQAEKLAAVCGRVFLVGKQPPVVATRFDFVRDLTPGRAAVHGIVAALTALGTPPPSSPPSPGAGDDWALVLAVDLPALKTEFLAALLERAKASGRAAAAPIAAGHVQGLCSAWNRDALAAVRERIQAGDLRVAGALEAAGAILIPESEVTAMPGGDAAAFLNLNTPEDHEAFQNPHLAEEIRFP